LDDDAVAGDEALYGDGESELVVVVVVDAGADAGGDAAFVKRP
jgi:hypothetical protein